MKKLVIIPAFNESGSILRAVQDIKEHAPGFDYVVINDCSTDDTLQVCQKNGLNHVNLSVNLGIGGAVQTGYIYGCQNHYDVAVQFDGDGQLTSALNYVTSTKEYKAYYTSGHGESSLSALLRKKDSSLPDCGEWASGIFPP